MPNDFKYDIFLSHSAKDEPVVAGVGEPVEAGQAARVVQWVEGDNIPAKIE